MIRVKYINDDNIVELDSKIKEISEFFKNIDDEDDDDDGNIVTLQFPYETLKALKKYLEIYDPYLEPIPKPLPYNDIYFLKNKEYISFLKELGSPNDYKLLFNVIECANFLDMPQLLEITTMYFATWIKNASLEQLKNFKFIKENKESIEVINKLLAEEATKNIKKEVENIEEEEEVKFRT